jgi:hypothetical protein
MDPRKTVVIADFDEVLRAAQTQRPTPPRAASEQPAVPRWGGQTVGWPSGGEAKDAVREERTSEVREKLSRAAKAAKASPTVLIGRTLVAGGEPRSVPVEKTKLWRQEDVTVREDVADGERQRAHVHIDEAVMQRLAAEVWAGQASQGSHMLVTTVRRSIMDVSTSVVTQRTSEPQPQTQVNSARITRDTSLKAEIVARVTTDDEPIVIPRLIRVPNARTIRITCLALCIASAGAIAIRSPALKQADGASQPAAGSVQSGKTAAASDQSRPFQVETTWRPRPAPAAATAPRRERSAETAAVAQSHPSQPPAATGHSTVPDASDLRPARAQVAMVGKPASGSGSGSASGKTAPLVASSGASPRAALDALIAGKQELALARYRALAKSDPSQPAYQAAARILEDAVARDTDRP